MKTMTSHVHHTRDLLHQSLGMMANIKVGVSNTSSNLVKVSSIYDDYSQSISKAGMYSKTLQKKEEQNNRNIKIAFWFLVFVAVFVVLRRMFVPDFYRAMWSRK
jgi:hypothetical protein